jgi:hypothetical protein
MELKPEIRHADLAGSKIEYLYYEGDGPVIIMLHATGFYPGCGTPLRKESPVHLK